MDAKLKESLTSYYDERAQEYEEIFLGKGHPTLNPNIYKNEAAEIGKIALTFGKGHLIDIGCGTGFWLPSYARNCLEITLIDLSEKSLKECNKKVDKLGLRNKIHVIQDDFLEVTFENSLFDSAIIGFFISHLTFNIQQEFFGKLKQILKSDAKIMIIDSAWSWKRQQYRKKEGMLERVLNDGRKFMIYQRYFDESDIKQIVNKYRFKLESYYLGDVYLAVICENC